MPFKSKESPTSLRCGSEASDITDTMSCSAGDFKTSERFSARWSDTPTRISRAVQTRGWTVKKPSKREVSETDQKATQIGTLGSSRLLNRFSTYCFLFENPSRSLEIALDVVAASPMAWNAAHQNNRRDKWPDGSDAGGRWKECGVVSC